MSDKDYLTIKHYVSTHPKVVEGMRSRRFKSVWYPVRFFLRYFFTSKP